MSKHSILKELTLCCVVMGLAVFSTEVKSEIIGDGGQKTIEMKKYSVELPHFISINYKGKVALSIGYIELQGEGEKQIIAGGPLCRIINREDKPDMKELTWESDKNPIFSCKSKMELYDSKVIYTLTYEFHKDFKGSIYMLPGIEPAFVLGSSYKAIKADGAIEEGQIPNVTNVYTGIPRHTHLSEATIHTKEHGTIIYRLTMEDYPKEAQSIRIPVTTDGKTDVRLMLCQGKPAGFPSGYSNEIKIEIEFE